MTSYNDVQKKWNDFLKVQWKVCRFWENYEDHYMLLIRTANSQIINSLILKNSYGNFNGLSVNDLITLTLKENLSAEIIETLQQIKPTNNYWFNCFNVEAEYLLTKKSKIPFLENKILFGEWRVERFWLSYEAHYMLIKRTMSSKNQVINYLILHHANGYFDGLYEKNVVNLTVNSYVGEPTHCQSYPFVNFNLIRR